MYSVTPTKEDFVCGKAALLGAIIQGSFVCEMYKQPTDSLQFYDVFYLCLVQNVSASNPTIFRAMCFVQDYNCLVQGYNCS